MENLAVLTGGDCDSEDAWIGIIATGVSEDVRYNGSTDWERISRGVATRGKESLSRDVRCRRLRVEDGDAAGSQLNGAYDVVDAGDTGGSGIHCICHKTEWSSTYINHSIKSCKSQSTMCSIYYTLANCSLLLTICTVACLPHMQFCTKHRHQLKEGLPCTIQWLRKITYFQHSNNLILLWKWVSVPHDKNNVAWGD